MKHGVQPAANVPLGVRGLAGLLALLVHVLFFALLVFGVDWKQRDNGPVSVQLWTPSELNAGAGGHGAQGQGGHLATPQPRVPPPPQPAPPPVAPPPAPQPAPPLPQLPALAPQSPLPEQGEAKQPAPDIALAEKKKREAEKKKREALQQQLELAQQKQMKQQAEQAAAVQTEKLKQLLVQQTQAGIRAESEHALAGARALVAAGQRASQQQRLLDEYSNRIRAKIRSRIILPDGLQGNPEAIFDVTVLPTGEVVGVALRHPSGQPVYDQAVERAIYKASPLPLPPDPQLAAQFRDLNLHFSPDDKK